MYTTSPNQNWLGIIRRNNWYQTLFTFPSVLIVQRWLLQLLGWLFSLGIHWLWAAYGSTGQAQMCCIWSLQSVKRQIRKGKLGQHFIIQALVKLLLLSHYSPSSSPETTLISVFMYAAFGSNTFDLLKGTLILSAVSVLNVIKGIYEAGIHYKGPGNAHCESLFYFSCCKGTVLQPPLFIRKVKLK